MSNILERVREYELPPSDDMAGINSLTQGGKLQRKEVFLVPNSFLTSVLKVLDRLSLQDSPNGSY